MAGALELGKAWITVGVDHRGLPSELAKVNGTVVKALQQMGDSAAGVYKSVHAAGGKFMGSGVGGAAAGAMAGGVGGAARGFFQGGPAGAVRGGAAGAATGAAGGLFAGLRSGGAAGGGAATNEALQQTAESTQNLSDHAKDAAKSIEDLSAKQLQAAETAKMMSAATAVMFGTIAAFGKNVLSRGIGLATEFEKTTVEMEVMIGTAEETKKTLADITAFAVATPFEMPQLLAVSKQLITFGDRGTKLMETLKVLGDASGGTNEKFQLLGAVFNKIRGTNRLLTEEFRQLSNRGILSLQDIAKHYKISTAAANKMMTDGKISFAAFSKILKSTTEQGGRYYKMMELTSRTMDGLGSTFRDAVGITYRFIGTPLLPYLKILTMWATNIVNVFGSLVQMGGEIASFAVVSVVAFSTLGAAIFGCRIAMMLLGVQAKSTFQMMIIGIRAVMKVTVWLAVAAAIGALVGWFVRLKPVQEFFTAAWKIVGETLDKVTKLFGELWTMTQGPTNQSTSAIKGFAGWVDFLGHYIDNCLIRFKAFYISILPQITQIGTLWFGLTDNLQRIFFSAVEAISSFLFGGTGHWMDTFEGFVTFAVTWVEYFLDVFVFFTTDLGLTWQLLCTNLAYYVMVAIDQIMVIWNTMVATVMALGYSLFTTFYVAFENIGKAAWGLGEEFLAWGAYALGVMSDIAHNILLAFKRTFLEAGHIATAVMVGIKAKLAGGNYQEAYRNSMNISKKEYDAVQSLQYLEVGAKGKQDYDLMQKNKTKMKFKDPIEEGFDAFTETFTNNMGADSPMKAQIDALGEQAKSITGAINQKKKQDARDRIAIDEPKKKALDDKKKLEAAPETTAALTQGKYGFSDIGNKIQEELLKGKDGTAEKQLAATEAGNTIQGDILTGVKKLAPPGVKN